MINKVAIPVYYPTDPFERSVQDAFHDISGEYLNHYQCRLVTKSIISLKQFDDNWSNEHLFRHRAAYFFAPHLTSHMERVVFVTHLIYLRDILENKLISSSIHSPITLVSVPLAYYLFREYFVHIHLDRSILQAANSDVDVLETGGLLIANEDMRLGNAVLDIVGSNNESEHANQLDDIKEQTGFARAAATEISRGVFKIDEHDRMIEADMEVFDKKLGEDAKIYAIEPGETGMVGIRYKGGFEKEVPKEEFDREYVVKEN